MITVAITKFRTVLGKDVICRLKSADAANLPVYEFVSSGSPLHITSGTNSATETPILTSTAELVIENIEPFRAMGFLSAAPKARMLEVEHGGIIIWTGYLVPDQWYENFAYTPYPTRFSFVDGLALLHEEKYVGADGTYLRGRAKDVVIIARCLFLIGVNREFVDQINIYDENAAGSAFQDGTLFHHYKDQEAFRELTCYEVLSQILISYKSRIEFYDNRYYISRIDNTDPTVYSVRWAFIGGTVGTTIIDRSWTPNKIQITPGNRKSNRFCWQETSQSIEKIPGWKSFEFIQIYGRKESMLARHRFEDDDWTVTGVLKNWQTIGMDKWEVDEEPVVRFIPLQEQGRSPDDGTGGSLATILSAKLSQTTLDEYSPVNVTDNNFEQFVLEIDTQAGTFRYSEVGSYYGPRIYGGSTVAAGHILQFSRPATTFTPVEQFLIGVRQSPPQTWPVACFHVSRGGLFRRELVIGSVLIFRDPANIPRPFAAGIVYKIVDIIEDSENYWFQIHQEFPPLIVSPFISINSEELDKTYNVSFWFVIIPCLVQILREATPQASLGLDGGWGNDRNYLYLEVQKNDIDSRKKFTTGSTSDGRPLLNQIPGRIYFEMARPRDTSGEWQRGRQGGTWFVQAVRLFLADTPEKYEKTIMVNPLNTRTGEVTIHFAETPIKTNFPNNNLKFFNNFYSLSTTQAPGLQYHHGDIGTAEKEIGVYGFLYNKWAADVIANTSTNAWRVSTYADVVDLTNLPGTTLEPSEFRRVGLLLKSTRRVAVEGHPGWSENPNSNDLYNFSILPAGERISFLGRYLFSGQSFRAVMWLGNSNESWMTWATSDRIVYQTARHLQAGCSIRLCRNLLPGEASIPNGHPGIEYIGNDGKSYRTVKINNRIWIGESLRETKTNTGVDIPRVELPDAWAALNSMGYCYVNNAPQMSFTTVTTPVGKLNKSSLRDMIINFYKGLYRNSRLLLSGIINANSELTPFGKILQEKHTERDYIRMETTWDVHRNTFRGAWHELTKTMDDGFVRSGSYGRDYNKNQYN